MEAPSVNWSNGRLCDFLGITLHSAWRHGASPSRLTKGLTVGVGGEQNMAAFTIGYQNGYSDSKKANSPGGQGYAAAYKSGLMTGMTVRRRNPTAATLSSVPLPC